MPFNLYALRHEKRSMLTPLFDTPLLTEGQNNAENIIVEKLKYFQIDIIYTSPFKRCIDTVMPYAIKYNVPVHVDYRLYEWLNNPDFESAPIGKLEDPSIYSSVTHQDIVLEFPESITQRKMRVNEFMSDLDTKYNNTNLNILVCAHMDIVHDVISHRVHEWPGGYIAMGSLIDVQNISQHITSLLLLYAHFCNYIIPVLHRVLYIMKLNKSLKENATLLLKQCQSLPSHCTTTKVMDSIGWLSEKTQKQLSKAKVWLKEAFSQMRLASEKQ